MNWIPNNAADEAPLRMEAGIISEDDLVMIPRPENRKYSLLNMYISMHYLHDM